MDDSVREWRGGCEEGQAALFIAGLVALLGLAFLLSPWAREVFGGRSTMWVWGSVAYALAHSLRPLHRWMALATLFASMYGLIFFAPSLLDPALGLAILALAAGGAVEGIRALRSPATMRVTGRSLEGERSGRIWRADFEDLGGARVERRRVLLTVRPSFRRSFGMRLNRFFTGGDLTLDGWTLDGWTLAGADPGEVAALVRDRLRRIN